MTTLYDTIIRQQVYLEGVKTERSNALSREVAQIFTLYIDELKSYSEETLEFLSKTKLLAMLARIRKQVLAQYAKFNIEYLAFLEEFTRIEASLTAIVTKEVADDLQRNVALNQFGKKFSANVWASLPNSIMPSTGEILTKYIEAFGLGLVLKIENTIRAGYVNSEKISNIVDRMSTRKGGIGSRLFADARSMIATTIQHVSASVNEAVHSLFYNQYFWCSIIDGSTSNICRDRNGNVYVYGSGPIPPAHPHCRSRAVPFTENMKRQTESFAKWLTTQSDEIKKFALSEAPPLTLKQYRDKAGAIVV